MLLCFRHDVWALFKNVRYLCVIRAYLDKDKYWLFYNADVMRVSSQRPRNMQKNMIFVVKNELI